MKKAIIIATIISTAAVLGACRERHEPMKGIGKYVAPVSQVK
jgi:predicted small secreted protein